MRRPKLKPIAVRPVFDGKWIDAILSPLMFEMIAGEQRMFSAPAGQVWMTSLIFF
ncbi:hypothetical protein [Corallococcus sp. AB011P]|uniref:hypothetical protein n=1 Tax=Corallococcus sp. AB011P TaxID=2316735 RepID=UPI001F25C945|nr:hypothetical protein [Corallococcus sp. AB011P]